MPRARWKAADTDIFCYFDFLLYCRKRSIFGTCFVNFGIQGSLCREIVCDTLNLSYLGCLGHRGFFYVKWFAKMLNYQGFNVRMMYGGKVIDGA